MHLPRIFTWNNPDYPHDRLVKRFDAREFPYSSVVFTYKYGFGLIETAFNRVDTRVQLVSHRYGDIQHVTHFVAYNNREDVTLWFKKVNGRLTKGTSHQLPKFLLTRELAGAEILLSNVDSSVGEEAEYTRNIIHYAGGFGVFEAYERRDFGRWLQFQRAQWSGPNGGCVAEFCKDPETNVWSIESTRVEGGVDDTDPELEQDEDDPDFELIYSRVNDCMIQQINWL